MDASAPLIPGGGVDGIVKSPFVPLTCILSAVSAILLFGSMGAPWEEESTAGSTLTRYPFQVCATIGTASSCSTADLTGDARTTFIFACGIVNAILGFLALVLCALSALRVFAPSSRAATQIATHPVLFGCAVVLAVGLFASAVTASIKVAALTAYSEGYYSILKLSAVPAAGVYLTGFSFVLSYLAAHAAWGTPRDEVVTEDVYEAEPAPRTVYAPRPARQRAPPPPPAYAPEPLMYAQQQAPPSYAPPQQQQAPLSYAPPPQQYGLSAPPAVQGFPPPTQQQFARPPTAQPALINAPPKFMSGATAAGGEVVAMPAFAGGRGGSPDPGAPRRAIVRRAASTVGATPGDVASEEDVMHLLKRASAAVERASTEARVDLSDDDFKGAVLDLMRGIFDSTRVETQLAAKYLTVIADKI